MRLTKNLLLAGAAALALAGGAGLALAQPLHVMTVPLAGGGFANIQYSGKVPPRVTFGPGPLAAGYDRPASPFAMLDRISARMDREMDALMRETAMPPPAVDPGGMFRIDTRNLPAGTMQYSFASTMGGNGNYCSRSVEITRASPGARPRVVERTSGNCRGMGNTSFGAAPVAPPDRAERGIQTRNLQSRPPSGPALLNVAYQPAR